MCRFIPLFFLSTECSADLLLKPTDLDYWFIPHLSAFFFGLAEGLKFPESVVDHSPNGTLSLLSSRYGAGGWGKRLAEYRMGCRYCTSGRTVHGLKFAFLELGCIPVFAPQSAV